MYFSDPLFQFQSYLSGVADIGSQPLDGRSPVFRINEIWDEFRGDGVLIAVPGVIDRLHPDIQANYDTSTLSQYDPLSIISSEPEAATLSTFWAGIAAADDNGVGMVGVAPDASVVSFASGTPQAAADIVIVPGGADRGDGVPIPFDKPFGRDGLGSIVIAENPFGDTLFGILGDDHASGDMNTDYALHNVRHIMTVSPLSAYGKQISSGVAGDMNLVGAPVFTDTSTTNFFEDVSTTIGPDPRGDLGVNGEGTTLGFWELIAESSTGVDIDGANYGILLSGTGANAVTGGVVALMLEANPDLGWRDVQEILAYSATFTDLQPGSQSSAGFPWDINGAQTWNNGGLHYGAQFGFGAIDVYGAVRLAETWTKVSTTANESKVDANRTTNIPNGAVSLDEGDSFGFNFSMPNDLSVEHAEVTVDFSVPEAILEARADMFEINLISPNGTTSQLAAPATVFDSIPGERVQHTFASRKFWGENAQDGNGTWTVEFVFQGLEDPAVTQFFDVSLTLFGNPNADDDIYVFTDEFDDLSGLGYSKNLNDSDGLNRINAAAMTGDLFLTAQADGEGQSDGALLYQLGSDTRIFNLIGGDGDDTIDGSGRNNLLEGMRGADVMDGLAGRDTLKGGAGGDDIAGSGGDDLIFGETGNDTVRGGDGGDTANGDAGADSMLGGAGADSFKGGDGADLINVGFGNDTAIGNAGNDTLLGGAGADRLDGGGGNDLLIAGDSTDTLIGGAGNDTMEGQAGNDSMSGGTGNDSMTAASGRDTMSGDDGNDVLDGGLGNDVITAGSGEDTVFGGDGNDTIQGGTGSDLLNGGLGADVINGAQNNDTLNGGGGQDSLFGGNNADVLNGGKGADLLAGNAGNDILTGGAGADIFEYDAGLDRITDFSVTADTLMLDDLLWGGGLNAGQVVSTFANVSGGNVVFDFAPGDVLTLDGVTSTSGLADQIDFL